MGFSWPPYEFPWGPKWLPHDPDAFKWESMGVPLGPNGAPWALLGAAWGPNGVPMAVHGTPNGLHGPQATVLLIHIFYLLLFSKGLDLKCARDLDMGDLSFYLFS